MSEPSIKPIQPTNEYVAARLRAACMDLRVSGELLYLDGKGTEALTIECMEKQLRQMAVDLETANG